MHSVMMVIGFMFGVFGLMGIYFKIQEIKDNHKNTIIPTPGTKFKVNA